MSEIEKDALEAAARGMHEHLHKDGGPPWGIWSEMFPADARHVRELGQAAIDAYLSAKRAEGFALMPREATEAMGMAGYVCHLPVFEDERSEPNPKDWRAAWTAMFDAATPKQES